MEVITIESKAFCRLVEDRQDSGIREASRQREQDGQQGQEEKRTAGRRAEWMTAARCANISEISPRTHNATARTGLSPSPSAEENPLPPHGRGTVPGTVDAGNTRQADRPDDQTTPLHERKYKLYGKKRGNTGKDE